ncbi:MAG: hypothetical protein GF375_04840 [Candidatus Omnitrophica bacterium]|nr:hypothetical protein [Candidatus Omnitrophota bacterium]MBD3269354.1 hypothetical protein [Candidatus Omnitrophota bacterium]
MKERRRFMRLNAQIKVELAKIGKVSGSTETKPATSKNISECGIAVTAYTRDFEVGDRVIIAAELPNKKIVGLEGRVAWIREFEVGSAESGSRGYDIGIEFIDVSFADIEAIREFENLSLNL